MKTKKNKSTNHNKTRRKSYKPDIKVIEPGFVLYASKKKKHGLKILDYTRKNKQKHKTHCIYNNITWFTSSLVEAKKYKKSDYGVYKWDIVNKTRLIKMSEENRVFFKKLFMNTKDNIKPFINIDSKEISKIDYDHPFLKMDNNEKALYELEFIFGYISLTKQYEFILFIKYLVENKFIELLSRYNTSLIVKIYRFILNYNLNKIGKREGLNRITLYPIVKNCVLNLCKMLNNKNIDGIYQPDINSFWYPKVISNYSYSIEEYILFSPHSNLGNVLEID